MASLSSQQQNNSAENNRTMLFQISRIDVKLISPDRKSVLLSKPFRDISHCSQGIQHPDNFGFICRDANSENYVCYVFKCLSSSVADEITAGNFSKKCV
jgi:TBC1 domain family member 4